MRIVGMFSPTTRQVCITSDEWSASMIDHVYISVADPARSLPFYVAALQPLGWREFVKYDAAAGPDSVPDLWGLIDGSGGTGRAISTSIWLRRRRDGETGLYLGLAANDTAEVDAAYAAALNAGGQDDGAPAQRSYFADGYYAANVIDFDGNRLEFVHKRWNPKRPL
jgi:catechol 2,3-dioxygenase-like lactoylglutathione lyase family enzyme